TVTDRHDPVHDPGIAKALRHKLRRLHLVSAGLRIRVEVPPDADQKLGSLLQGSIDRRTPVRHPELARETRNPIWILRDSRRFRKPARDCASRSATFMPSPASPEYSSPFPEIFGAGS